MDSLKPTHLLTLTQNCSDLQIFLWMYHHWSFWILSTIPWMYFTVVSDWCGPWSWLWNPLSVFNPDCLSGLATTFAFHVPTVHLQWKHYQTVYGFQIHTLPYFTHIMTWYKISFLKFQVNLLLFSLFFNCRQLFRTSGPHQYSDEDFWSSSVQCAKQKILWKSNELPLLVKQAVG